MNRIRHRVGQLLLGCGMAVGAVGIASADSLDNVNVVPVDTIEREEGAVAIVEYTDYATWLGAVGGPTVQNAYAELGDAVIVTNQYLPVGALYTDGDDITFPDGTSADGMYLNGDGRINITFSDNILAFGANYPGAIRIVGYLDDALVFTSSDFGGSGAGFFGGVISDEPFNRVEILDWVDDFVFIDDANYPEGGPTPTIKSSWGRVKAQY